MDSSKKPIRQWLRDHLEITLIGWFFFGMALCGLLAPEERVALLESDLVTQGWHLSLMAIGFGAIVVGAYVLRHSGRHQ